MKRTCWIFFLVLGVMVNWTVVYAGDLYVVPAKGQAPSWDQKITSPTRFKLVLDDEAVLDRTTGLVWDKTPDGATRNWTGACAHCYQRVVGGRKGWRAPAIEELASLVDTTATTPVKLPEGHPFIGVNTEPYWSSTTHGVYTTSAWLVAFDDGHLFNDDKSHATIYYVWCVRGGYGHDAY